MKTDSCGCKRKTIGPLASCVWLAAVAMSILELFGCTGISTTRTPIPVIVTIAPVSATVAASGTRQFTARVQNTSNTAVTWQVNVVTGGNATVGTLSSSGLYTAPASPATVTVTAVSQADATKSASAQVTITPPTAVSVTVSPTSATVAAGGTQQFTATVLGTGNVATPGHGSGGIGCN